MYCIVALLVATVAVAADGHDWKYFGSSGSTDAGDEWFCLPAEVKHLPGNKVQVWTEMIDSKKLRQYVIAQPHDGPVATSLRTKVSSGYVPPYAVVANLSAENAKSMILMEIVANTGALTPDGNGLYTLNCAEKTYRAEQMTFFDDDGNPAKSMPQTPWEAIAPGTVTDGLYSLVCK